MVTSSFDQVLSGTSAAGTNADNLRHALGFLEQVVRMRCAHLYDPAPQAPSDPPSLAYYQDDSALARFIESRKPSFDEYVVILLALAPHVAPDYLDRLIADALPASGDYPEIGGVRATGRSALMPTGETALWLLAGDHLDRRFAIQRLFTGDHWFAADNVLAVEAAAPGETYWSGRLILDQEYIEMFTLGQVSSPSFSPSFPAREIVTSLTWDDLVVGEEVLEQIEELRRWIDHHQALMGEWQMAGRLKPGYRALFHGPAGTGKTLTATLLGKHGLGPGRTGRKVFRIDLSTVVSKYIGETEKNLAKLFDRARSKDWILFFDEADALFGKRTAIKDSHDRYANQEVSYLLQRVEDFDGVVILATNLKANMDEAFLRRFNAVIRFPFPDADQREAIWRKAFPHGARFQKGIDLPKKLSRFELAGGNIVNAVQYTCIEMIARGSKTLALADALQGIRREVEKEGKVFRNLLEDGG